LAFVDKSTTSFERSQYVNVNGSYSSIKVIKNVVPQGSNLGPVLFSIYVNDIFYNLNIAPVLYANDTCLVAHASTVDELELRMNYELEKARI